MMNALSWFGGFVLFVIACFFGNQVLIPALLGYFLFVLVDPFVGWINARARISRVGASIIVILTAMLVSGTIVWIFSIAFTEIGRELPAYSQKLKGLLSTVIDRMDVIRKNTENVLPNNGVGDIPRVQLDHGYSGLADFALKGLGSAFELLTSMFFIPLIALFLLIDKPYFAKVMCQIFGSTKRANEIAFEISRMTRSFFIGNLIVGVGMALVLTLLFQSLGLHNAVSLGLTAGFINLIPFAGPFLSLVAPLAQGLLQFNSAAPFVIMSLAVIVLHFTVANVVVPKVIGSHINVNALAGTIGLLFWGWVWGALGLLLAIPLMALVRIALEIRPSTQVYSQLIGESKLRHR